MWIHLAEILLIYFVFFPVALFTTFEVNLYHKDREKNLVASNKEIVEPRGSWEKKKELPSFRYEFGVAKVGDNIYLVGGLYLPTVYAATNRTEAYNIKTDKWRNVSPLPAVIHHPGTTSDGKYVYVIGGDGTRTTPYSLAYKYTPNTDSWERLADMPTPRGALGLAALDGKIYAVGGATYDKKRNELEVYDPKTNSWEGKTPMPTPREHLAIAVVDEKIFVLGGLTTDRFHSLTTVEAYDPITDTWETKAPLPLPLSGFTAVGLENKIFVFGGQQGVAVSGEIHEYDAKKNSWNRKSNLPFPRYGAVGVAVEDKIHLFGGNRVVGSYQIINNHDIFVP